MLNRKFFFSIILIVAGLTFLGQAYGTEWDKQWGPGSIRIDGQPQFEVLQANIIGLSRALTLAESGTGGKAQGIYLRKMHGYLIYVADVVTPDSTCCKVIVDAGDGRILFVERPAQQRWFSNRLPDVAQ